MPNKGLTQPKTNPNLNLKDRNFRQIPNNPEPILDKLCTNLKPTSNKPLTQP
jgi:hypothetical protein